jgi:hypothetical protein
MLSCVSGCVVQGERPRRRCGHTARGGLVSSDSEHFTYKKAAGAAAVASQRLVWPETGFLGQISCKRGPRSVQVGAAVLFSGRKACIDCLMALAASNRPGRSPHRPATGGSLDASCYCARVAAQGGLMLTHSLLDPGLQADWQHLHQPSAAAAATAPAWRRQAGRP